ncbi:hypothetical protein KSS87_020640, partial [Heliosperma pusillum]
MKVLLRIAWILCIILVVLPTLAQRRPPPRSPQGSPPSEVRRPSPP